MKLRREAALADDAEIVEAERRAGGGSGGVGVEVALDLVLAAPFAEDEVGAFVPDVLVRIGRDFFEHLRPDVDGVGIRARGEPAVELRVGQLAFIASSWALPLG
jgi:hypothetical protein